MTRTTRGLLDGFEAALLRYERLSDVPYAIRSVSDSLGEARAALEKRIEALEKSHAELEKLRAKIALLDGTLEGERCDCRPYESCQWCENKT